MEDYGYMTPPKMIRKLQFSQRSNGFDDVSSQNDLEIQKVLLKMYATNTQTQTNTQTLVTVGSSATNTQTLVTVDSSATNTQTMTQVTVGLSRPTGLFTQPTYHQQVLLGMQPARPGRTQVTAPPWNAETCRYVVATVGFAHTVKAVVPIVQRRNVRWGRADKCYSGGNKKRYNINHFTK